MARDENKREIMDDDDTCANCDAPLDYFSVGWEGISMALSLFFCSKKCADAYIAGK